MSVLKLSQRSVGWLIGGFAILCALMLALPGATATSVYVNDLLIFLDGAHRIAVGQVPNRDFHTALGPLTYYLPAAGYWLSGSLGGAMPVAMGLSLLVLAPVVAHVLASRMRPAVALPFGAFAVMILAVPMNLGESIASLSFAMFYNRIGWAALAVLLVMYLRPLQPNTRGTALDALCAAVLTTAMLYSKITYGLVALAFVVFMLFDRAQRRWAAAAIGLTAIAGLLIELFWRGSAAHIADLLLTSRVSGTRGFIDMSLGFLGHLADYSLFGILVVLALWRRRSFRDFLFFGYCAGPGLLLMTQNSQPWGIITLHAGAAVAAELLLRDLSARAHVAAARPSLVAGVPLVLLALLLPTTLHCFAALSLHTGLAATRAGESFPMPNLEKVRLVELWRPGDVPFARAYLGSLNKGAQALATLPGEPSQVSVLDFVSPFSAGLGLKPPRGDWSWLHWGRNVNREQHLPGEDLLGGVEVLMVPKWGINNVPLLDIYRSYIAAEFEPVRETESWTVHRRRQKVEAAASEQRNPQDPLAR